MIVVSTATSSSAAALRTSSPTCRTSARTIGNDPTWMAKPTASFPRNVALASAPAASSRSVEATRRARIARCSALPPSASSASTAAPSRNNMSTIVAASWVAATCSMGSPRVCPKSRERNTIAAARSTRCASNAALRAAVDGVAPASMRHPSAVASGSSMTPLTCPAASTSASSSARPSPALRKSRASPRTSSSRASPHPITSCAAPIFAPPFTSACTVGREPAITA